MGAIDGVLILGNGIDFKPAVLEQEWAERVSIHYCYPDREFMFVVMDNSKPNVFKRMWMKRWG